ncbi:hypothetical protein TIFTF001_032036 [Ficus carica]|uniref:Uncharacterized protein n=1 Tax=Ficus carica TaxID=3494 RepID=A0AA88DWC7_FICCA|nr:hypothetical protein TIFTF001_031993 [Ficus carica]GMN62948.1 hypothetical protein TIFTF001_032036 [Ficus carica]
MVNGGSEHNIEDSRLYSRISRNELESEAVEFLLIHRRQRLHLKVVLALGLLPQLLEDLDRNHEAQGIVCVFAH